ncbi:TPA: winged helix-turn-helix transcriptional regulator [Candidatus Woesearchaeota archaeon]|nr:transcriptional regulator [archaeon]HIJ10436.1 winged helix-turn-helix transcriptional regulator [Candidatus Woesearchaeota archaeon]
MVSKQLQFYVNEGEGYNLEFKEGFSKDIAKEICAFANSTGGKIILGISDKNEIKGINVTNSLPSTIIDIARKLDPSVQVTTNQIENVLVVDVPEGKDKPYRCKEGFHLRIGSNSQKLTRDEIYEFFRKEGKLSWDDLENKKFEYPKDFNTKAYKKFLTSTGITQIESPEKTLENIDLIQQGKFTNAGVLLFNKEVRRFFIHGTITCFLYQGDNKYRILDRKEFTSDLRSNYEDAISYMMSKLNTELIIKIKRENVPELPEEALREALLNAIGHRDYTIRGANILVDIFSDRITMTNPGGLVGGLKKEEFGKRSLSRNRLLFGAMQRMDLVEEAGSGIYRIRKAMKKYRLQAPIFEMDDFWFSVTFKRPDLQKLSMQERLEGGRKSGRIGWSDKWSKEGLSERQIEILAIIKDNPKVSRRILAERVGINQSAIQRHLETLKGRGIIKRVGSDRGGYWVVLSNEKNKK